MVKMLVWAGLFVAVLFVPGPFKFMAFLLGGLVVVYLIWAFIPSRRPTPAAAHSSGDSTEAGVSNPMPSPQANQALAKAHEEEIRLLDEEQRERQELLEQNNRLLQESSDSVASPEPESWQDRLEAEAQR
jgi:flagellar biosynthesis/type III secretory pathway M-ring protein FliF/YscJ